MAIPQQDTSLACFKTHTFKASKTLLSLFLVNQMVHNFQKNINEICLTFFKQTITYLTYFLST